MPHPLNPRTHPEAQMDALTGSMEQFGDVRSLLAYRSPTKWPGKIVLIDGHARQSLDPNRPVYVELLKDLTDEEAEDLLKTIDPLAALAGYDEEKLAVLQQTRRADNETLQALWDALSANQSAVQNSLDRARKAEPVNTPAPTFRILIECDSEQAQVALWRRLKRDGIVCKML